MKKRIFISAIYVLSLLSAFSQGSPTRGMQVKWLTGLTYGISSYAYGGDPMSLYEMVVDTGLYAVSFSSAGPSAGIYTNNGFYFTYTLPAIGDYSVLQHFNTTGPGGAGVYGYVRAIYDDSIPLTPLDCHASFFIGPDTTGSVNDWVLYDFSTSTGTPTYFWDFGDGSTSTLTNPTHTYSSLGNYMICLTISDGICTDTYCDSAFLDINQPGSGVLNIRMMQVTAGVNESNSELFFNVYPNPVDNELTLSLSNDGNNDKFSFSILDVTGRKLQSNVEVPSANNNKIDISQLSSGIYLLEVSDGKVSGMKRFIKK